MSQASTARLGTATCVILGSLLIPPARAATYTTPQQLVVNDTYQLNPDAATGDEQTTCPKIDLNNGAGGDNPYFQRFNVARAHLGGCSERYWYTSSFQMLCADNPPVNTCGGGPCIDEPHPADVQYVDYIPPFGNGANELTPGRYRIAGEYRFTDSRATYPAQYIVNHAGGATTVLKSQRDGVLNSCPSFEIGTFDLDTGSSVRVNDPGTSSITFNRMRFTLIGGFGGVPLVHAGSDQTIILPNSAVLAGQAGDDGQPDPLVTTWSKQSGPGTVTFADASSPSTTATFSAPGSYVLRLTADDGANTVSDDVNITVLPEGTALMYSTQYEFDADPSLPAGVIDADPNDANGDGLLTKIGNGFGAAGAGAGIANGILRYVDNSGSTGNFGWYWQNGGANTSFTLDIAVRVNAGVSGTLNRRSLGVSGGTNQNLGIRLHKTHDGSGACSAGSIRLAASSGGTGNEACMDFSTPDFHRLRISVDSVANNIHVFDLDNQTLLTQAPGGGGTSLSWADQIDNLGGFHIGSISNSNTTLTDYELDYVRVLLGVAVENASTVILPVGLCNPVFADMDGDGDVDMDDFAIFQRCYTGSALITDMSCRCLDRNSDNRIDVFDFASFRACADASRASVVADPSCGGP